MPSTQTSAELALPTDPFRLSDEVELVADQVIADNSGFQMLNEIRIAYLLRIDESIDDDDSIDTICKAVKAPPVWQVLAGYDVAVWVKSAYWTVFNDRQKRALVTHALCHVYVDDETGKVKMLGHDVEEFHRVAMQFGGWTASVAQFAKAIEVERTQQRDVQSAISEAVDALDGTTFEVDDLEASVSVERRPR